MSIDTITSALHAHKLRKVGPDRYRAICPACGERNANTLSVGASPTGAVLVKCFKTECSIEDICASLGLTVSDLFPSRESHSGPVQRRRLLSASQALEMLHDESQLVALVASDIARGQHVTDTDCDRVLQAAGRIAYLRDEVRA